MWFWFSLIALVCWSGSDLFSKIGCQDADDKYSHLKMVMAVGLVMGLHAAYEIFIGGTEINGSIILTYLPVSLLYISSMTIGYIGLRYIELSISSPICNSSGALVAVLALATGGLGELVPAQLAATALVCVGVIGLGIVEAREDDDLRAARQQASNHRYAKSALALILLVFAGGYLYLKKRLSEMQNTVLVRNRKANKVALQRLRAAFQHMNAGSEKAFYEEMLKALWGYMSDKLNIPVANLTKDNIREELLKRNVSAELTGQFIDTITHC